MLVCLSSSYGKMAMYNSPLQNWQSTLFSNGHPSQRSVLQMSCLPKAWPSDHESDHGSLHLGKSAFLRMDEVVRPLTVLPSCIRRRGSTDHHCLCSTQCHRAGKRPACKHVSHSPTSKQMDQDEPIFCNKVLYHRKFWTHESERDDGDPLYSHYQILDPD